MLLFGFLNWRGRTHAEFSQLWRRAKLPVEAVSGPPRWLLRRPLLKNWELPFGRGIALWQISERDKDFIIRRVQERLAATGDAFEVER